MGRFLSPDASDILSCKSGNWNQENKKEQEADADQDQLLQQLLLSYQWPTTSRSHTACLYSPAAFEGVHDFQSVLVVSELIGSAPQTGSQPATQWFWVMNPKNLTDSGHYS